MTSSCLVLHALYWVGSYSPTPSDWTVGKQVMAEARRKVPLEPSYAHWVLAGRRVPEWELKNEPRKCLKRNLWLTVGVELPENWCLDQVPVAEDQALRYCYGRNQERKQFWEYLYDPHST